MARYGAVTGLAVLVAGLWALYAISGDYRVFGGVSTASVTLWVAWIATAALLVLVVGRLLVGVGFTLLGRESTGLQRGIIYSILTFVFVSIILGSLGVNIAAILATSFVATAIVGLAMQPTIGGLIAGSALQLDRVLQVGDVILLNGERVEIVSLNWRSVVGRKQGGTTVIIPNARIADTQLDIQRAGQPVRAELLIPAAVTAPPHRVAEILSEAIYDLPYVDPALPVNVVPFDYQFVGGFINYRVRYWVRHKHDLAQTRAALLARTWYVFQREGIPWRVPGDLAKTYDPIRLPATDGFKGLRLEQLAEANVPGLRSIAVGQEVPPDVGSRVIANCGAPLYYCDGELIVLPRHVGEQLFLLAAGELREASVATAVLDRRSNVAPWMRDTVQSGRRMAIERIAANLAHHIGPYAEHVVREAAAANPHPEAVAEAVAREIDDPAARERFLRGLHVDYDETLKPGLVFGRQRGAYSRVSSPPLRAVGVAVVIPIVLETSAPVAVKSKRSNA